jgi:hypothetical protein
MTSIEPNRARHGFVARWPFGWTLRGRAVQITKTPQGDVVGYHSTVLSFDPKRSLW